MTDITVLDGAFPTEQWTGIYAVLKSTMWKHGWKSNNATDHFTFWNKNYVTALPVTTPPTPVDPLADVSARVNNPIVLDAWQHLLAGPLAGHKLLRCYANALPFGTEGTMHADSSEPNTFTTIYYPHDKWLPNWGGDTVFFDDSGDDIVQTVYPKPNRAVTFPSKMNHVARGVTRICPKMRITLMFKTLAPTPAATPAASPTA